MRLFLYVFLINILVMNKVSANIVVEEDWYYEAKSAVIIDATIKKIDLDNDGQVELDSIKYLKNEWSRNCGGALYIDDATVIDKVRLNKRYIFYIVEISPPHQECYIIRASEATADNLHKVNMLIKENTQLVETFMKLKLESVVKNNDYLLRVKKDLKGINGLDTHAASKKKLIDLGPEVIAYLIYLLEDNSEFKLQAMYLDTISEDAFEQKIKYSPALMQDVIAILLMRKTGIRFHNVSRLSNDYERELLSRAWKIFFMRLGLDSKIFEPPKDKKKIGDQSASK